VARRAAPADRRLPAAVPDPTAVMPAARPLPLAALASGALALAACASSPRMVSTSTTSTSTTATGPAASAGPSASAAAAGLPPDAAGAAAQLAASPRHGEYAMVPVPGGDAADSVRAWVVFPQRATKAPVVVVVHEIFGLSTWVRAVADQLAADGFIAVAPDLLTGFAPPDAPDSVNVAAIRRLDAAQVQRRVAAAGAYGMGLPAGAPQYGVVGFCWGGSTVFQHAVFAGQNGTPGFGAGVVYYGGAPNPALVAQVKAPLLGLFGENDARVNATIPPADSALRANGRAHEFTTFAGAGHGFLRQQSGQNGANRAASQQAWPRTVGWFRRHLGA
jgi:carboxymethylenebutenolidase